MKYTREVENEDLIKHMIIYLLSCIGKDIGYDTLINIITDAANVSYFNFQLCYDSLERAGFIHSYKNEDNKQMCSPTESTLEAGPLYKNDIPRYIREPLQRATVSRMDEEFKKNLVRYDIVEVRDGEFSLKLIIKDIDDTELLNLVFYTGDRDEAVAMAERFSKKPDVIYDKFMRVLIGEI